MGDVENLGKARADRTNDCRDWTVTDALREALRKVESGEIKPEMVYVAFYSHTEDRLCEYDYQCAGGKKIELLGLLTRHLQITGEF
jgi:hypothetical protein